MSRFVCNHSYLTAITLLIEFVVFLKRVALVAVIGVLLEQGAVWIGQELITFECETYRVLLDPGLFTS